MPSITSFEIHAWANVISIVLSQYNLLSNLPPWLLLRQIYLGLKYLSRLFLLHRIFLNLGKRSAISQNRKFCRYLRLRSDSYEHGKAFSEHICSRLTSLQKHRSILPCVFTAYNSYELLPYRVAPRFWALYQFWPFEGYNRSMTSWFEKKWFCLKLFCVYLTGEVYNSREMFVGVRRKLELIFEKMRARNFFVFISYNRVETLCKSVSDCFCYIRERCPHKSFIIKINI